MDREAEIRLIAYHIWEQEGCAHGRDCEHWVRAEQIWESQNSPPAVKTRKKPAARKTRKTKTTRAT